MSVATTSHWTLLVQDLDRSIQFYTEILGWHPVAARRDERMPVRLVRDGQRVELAERPGTARGAVRPAVNHLGLSHLTVATGSALPLMGELDRHGVVVRRHTLGRFVPEPGDAGPSQFLFEDPDGNLIETFVAEGDDWCPFGSTGESEAEPSAVGVRHLSHWSLCVSEPERSLRFYREVLGWQELAAMEWEGDGPSRVMDVGPARLTTWLMAAGDQRIEIIHFDRPPVEPRPGAGTEVPGLSHLTVQVDDVGIAARGLAGARVVTAPIEDENGPALLGHDPDGIPIRWSAAKLDWTTS